MLEMIVGRVRAKKEEPVEEEELKDSEPGNLRMWVSHLAENKMKWKERCKPKGETLEQFGHYEKKNYNTYLKGFDALGQ